jgi:hypothetical protein
MQLELPPISITSLEESILGLVALICTAIVSWEMIAMKIRPKCIVCSYGVARKEQAGQMPVPCHKHCHYVAKLLVKPAAGP